MSGRISLARRSFSVGGCSMKITEDVRKYAAEQGIAEAEALESGMQEKSKEFSEAGAELYAKA
jgi:phosphomethylpyrimidine synthase